MPTTPDPWFASWACNCTAVETDRANIPNHCPNHTEPLLAPASQLTGYTGPLGVETHDQTAARIGLA